MRLAPEPRSLTINRWALDGRAVQRQGHFFDPALVSSQFETLEPPRGALAIDVRKTPDAIVERIVQAVEKWNEGD